MPHGNETPKRIFLWGHGPKVERVAGGTITPGDLIKLNSSDKVVRHDAAAGEAESAFALEDALQGNTIADDYASDDPVSYVIGQRGDKIYAWLASGENASIGSFLTSNADGKLKVATANTDRVVAVALEAKDQSQTGDGDARIVVRVV